MCLLEAQALCYQASEVPQQKPRDAQGSKYLRHHLACSGAAANCSSRGYCDWCTHLRYPPSLLQLIADKRLPQYDYFCQGPLPGLQKFPPSCSTFTFQLLGTS